MVPPTPPIDASIGPIPPAPPPPALPTSGALLMPPPSTPPAPGSSENTPVSGDDAIPVLPFPPDPPNAAEPAFTGFPVEVKPSPGPPWPGEPVCSVGEIFAPPPPR